MGTGDAFGGVIDGMKARHLEGGKPVVTNVPAEYKDLTRRAPASPSSWSRPTASS